MELEVNTDGKSEEAVFEVEDDIYDAALENERCGICMDIVIDRGVLDCCHHWFCFACIDNWATITNLCPLCKNEFQLITCLPVYDTIGNTKVEEYLLSRDEDWSIQGKNNTLSFPSYYINEDAVICLDGDGCKMRSGLSTAEEDLVLDTSIACDSCDLWYHAFCVGFDTESTSENSWLCPRCIPDEVQQKSDGISEQNVGKPRGQRIIDVGHLIDPSFSRKVSVSLADAGETAVVVSMVEGTQLMEASEIVTLKNRTDVNLEEELSLANFDATSCQLDVQHNEISHVELQNYNLISHGDKRFDDIALDANCSSKTSLDLSSESTIIPPDVDINETFLAFPLSQDASSRKTIIEPNIVVSKTSLALSLAEVEPLSSPCDPLALNDSMVSSTERMIHKPCTSDEHKVSSSLLIDHSYTKSKSPENESIITPLGLSAGLCSDKVAVDGTENQVVADNSQLPLEQSSLAVNKMARDANEDMAGVVHQKNLEVSGLIKNHTEKSMSTVIDDVHTSHHTTKRERDSQEKIMETEGFAKKARSDGKFQMVCLKVNSSVSDEYQGPSKTVAISKDNELRRASEKEEFTSDIRNIVQGIGHRSFNKLVGVNSADESTKERENAAGLRVKKIMRRGGGNNESSILVQKLRKEIRDAAHGKTISDFDKDAGFDGKLLTAFRVAIARPRNELVKKADPSLVRVKKSQLQRGKIRENLTKKIYGTTSGRRRRAWDRDCEIEFWKHRCTSTRPEKVETLQSVLDLLKKINSSSENSEMEQGPEGETLNSVLSRVYLADSSVFPRKEDIKPLSALPGSSVISNFEQNKKWKSGNASQESHMIKTVGGVSSSPLQGVVPSCDSRGKKISGLNFKGEANCRKEHSNALKTGGQTSTSSNSKDNSQTSMELPGKSVSSKTDKRKWALEVLARKNAFTNPETTQQKQEDNILLKGNYPLLAQLPLDMRPVLAPGSHNKVLVSVRQAQLYRLTEHYLRRTNLAIIRRTAETELAVADAVNIEKEIFERSNSKLVYINLCSQHTINSKTKRVEMDVSHPTAVISEGTEQAAKEAAADPAATSSCVEEALKKAGLLSDSPPNSPYQPTKGTNEEDAPSGNVGEEGLENIFDIDSHPELDIYGDFEYDLEDEGYIASSSMASALRVSKLQPEDGDSKMKVVLSSLNGVQLDDALESKDDMNKPLIYEVANNLDKLGTVEEPPDRSRKERGMVKTTTKIGSDIPCFLPETTAEERYEEPSLAECEELYGPDKEPLVKRISEKPTETTSRNMIAGEHEIDMSKDGEFERESSAENNFVGGRLPDNHESSGGKSSPTHSLMGENNLTKKSRAKPNCSSTSDSNHSISKQVEAYVKEHIRPLCKSGVITAEQYRWAVGKTVDKVMKYHSKAKNANFLIKEGEKVKKLSEQYIEGAQQKEWK